VSKKTAMNPRIIPRRCFRVIVSPRKKYDRTTVTKTYNVLNGITTFAAATFSTA
jgi:hypothetical protein